MDSNVSAIVTPSTDILLPKGDLIVPGWYKNLSNEDYHSSNGSSSSQVKTLLKQTGAHFENNRKNKVNKATDTKSLGTAFHSITLEPHNFNDDIIVRPTSIKTRSGKEWEDFKLEAGSRTIITEDQFKAALQMASNVRKNPYLKRLIENIVPESSIYWMYKPTDPDDGEYNELVKCRPDAISMDYPVVIDLKSAIDASFTAFMKAMKDYFYHFSAAMYLDGVNSCTELLNTTNHFAFTKFVFIVVENEHPYLPASYELSLDDWNLGDLQYRTAMKNLRIAREDDWPGYPEGPRMTNLSKFAARSHTI